MQWSPVATPIVLRKADINTPKICGLFLIKLSQIMKESEMHKSLTQMAGLNINFLDPHMIHKGLLQNLLNVMKGHKIIREWINSHGHQLFIATPRTNRHHSNHRSLIFNWLLLHAMRKKRCWISSLESSHRKSFLLELCHLVSSNQEESAIAAKCWDFYPCNIQMKEPLALVP